MKEDSHFGVFINFETPGLYERQPLSSGGVTNDNATFFKLLRFNLLCCFWLNEISNKDDCVKCI